MPSLKGSNRIAEDRNFARIGQFPVAACGRRCDLPKRESVGKQQDAKRNPKEAPPENSHPSALAEMATARNMSEAKLMSEYLSSLKVYGRTVEDSVGKEFLPWLIRFGQVVAADKPRFDAWQKLLKLKCDVLALMRDLFLFTHPEDAQHAKTKTTPDVLKDSCRFLKEELDKLIPKYGTLHKHTSKLFADPKLKLLSVLSKETSVLFSEPTNLMDTAQQELNIMRDWAGKMASLKTGAKDFYLYSMAVRLRQSTGEYHMLDLTALIEAALAAHGGTDEEVLDHDNLERRVQRYADRMNLPRHERGTSKKEQ